MFVSVYGFCGPSTAAVFQKICVDIWNFGDCFGRCPVEGVFNAERHLQAAASKRFAHSVTPGWPRTDEVIMYVDVGMVQAKFQAQQQGQCVQPMANVQRCEREEAEATQQRTLRLRQLRREFQDYVNFCCGA